MWAGPLQYTDSGGSVFFPNRVGNSLYCWLGELTPPTSREAGRLDPFTTREGNELITRPQSEIPQHFRIQTVAGRSRQPKVLRVIHILIPGG